MDEEAAMENVNRKCSEEDECTVEDCSGDVERKTKRRGKNKTSNAKEVEENGEGGSKTKNTKERKKMHKAKRKRESVDFEKEGDSSLLQQEKMSEYSVEGNIGLAEQDEEIERKKKVKNKYEEIERKKKVKNKYNDNVLMHHINEMQIGELECAKKKKKKKKHTQLIDSSSDAFLDNGVECDEKRKMKRTTPLENGSGEMENVGGDGLVRGKWFSPEEDETVKAAVLHYIEKNDLGDEGLDMVLNCMKYPKVKGCWKEIGTAIPYRPRNAIYHRAQILFRRSEFRKWTQEEYDLLRSYQKEHGNKWKAIAVELGKHPMHVRDAWRMIKGNYNSGRWSQDEYQKLFNLVNLDLQAKLSEEKISNHGMLNDNICWTAISEVHSTRSQTRCCRQWYSQLTSRMVGDGVWACKDDYRLIDALYGLDATCVEDVDWDVLLDNRERDVCRKRWDQMVLHIGHHRNKSFSEQVEVLAQRYCPALLEAREIWDSKPRVG